MKKNWLRTEKDAYIKKESEFIASSSDPKAPILNMTQEKIPDMVESNKYMSPQDKLVDQQRRSWAYEQEWGDLMNEKIRTNDVDTWLANELGLTLPNYYYATQDKSSPDKDTFNKLIKMIRPMRGIDFSLREEEINLYSE